MCTEKTLGQNSCIDLGGRHIEIHETPGHSSCSISAYVPQLKALFPSDAVAIPYRDEYVIAAGSSFEKYQQSLDKLALLDVEILMRGSLRIYYRRRSNALYCKKQKRNGSHD